MKRSEAAEALANQLRLHDIKVEEEHMFAPVVDGKHIRRWRFDVALPEHLVAVEVDGSVFTGGRHGGKPSAIRDIEKRQAAACCGWRMIPVTPDMCLNGRALDVVMFAIEREEHEWPF